MSGPRSRAENAASDAAGDEVVKLDPHRQGGMTTHVEYVGSVRQRLTKQTDEKQERSNPSSNAVSDYYYGIYKQQQAADAEREAQQLRDEQQRAAQQKAEQDEARKNLAVNLMLSSASPAEVAQVKAIVARNFPADKYSPERHWLVLQKLRNAVGIGSGPKASWVEQF